MAIIGSLMKTDMIKVAPDARVIDAVDLMAQNHVGAVLVVKGETLKGILSERDVLTRVVVEGLEPASTAVSQVATHDVVSVDIGTPVRKCAELLLAMDVRHLPVTEDNRPVGILSSRDFLAYVVGGLERVVDRFQYKEGLQEGEDPYDHLGGSYGK